MKGQDKAPGWDEFRAAGMLWWVNRILHTFGWSICVMENDAGEVIGTECIRSTWLGFPDAVNEEEWAKWKESQ